MIRHNRVVVINGEIAHKGPNRLGYNGVIDNTTDGGSFVGEIPLRISQDATIEDRQASVATELEELPSI